MSSASESTLSDGGPSPDVCGDVPAIDCDYFRGRRKIIAESNLLYNLIYFTAFVVYTRLSRARGDEKCKENEFSIVQHPY